jgi:TPR repeat protein
MYRLGEYYYQHVEGGETGDYHQAFEWMLKAAAQVEESKFPFLTF